MKRSSFGTVGTPLHATARPGCAHCPVELDYQPASLQAVWDWLREWVRGPVEDVATPDPIFWIGPLSGSAAERRFAAVESVIGYLEQTFWRRYPTLVPAIARTPAPGQEVRDEYAPGLDWAPRVKWGATIATGSLATRLAGTLDGGPQDKYGIDDWLPRMHGYLEKGLAVSKKELKRRKPPVPTAKISKWRDPDDPTYSFEGGFTEETIYDFPTVAIATAEMLAALEGVDEALHHDSNAILIAGPIRSRELRAALKRHLARPH